ncbi:MAG: DUF1624 domain-containing protein [Planctomycetaceae bacterium]|nr:DUF1624 domain-containing protein [Planctomycetaceae bacterium]
MSYKIVEELQSSHERKPASELPPPSPPSEEGKKTSRPQPVPRLVSLDAYRGFIMILLAASGFGLGRMARQPEESRLWELVSRDQFERLAFHFDHPPWQSNYAYGSLDAREGNPWMRFKVSFWDLIQPAFMFMVGVAMPFSYRRREGVGQSPWKRTIHATVRAVVLISLGVFLYSQQYESTNWIFTNVLAQIGLGYFFVYLLAQRPHWMQVTGFAVILVGTWIGVHVYEPPPLGEIELNRETMNRQELLEQIGSAYDPEEVNASYEKAEIFAPPYQQWSKNGNAFHDFDVWALNVLPRPQSDDPFLFNGGGYQTLNFVPSMATMLLGLFCGQLLLSAVPPRRKFFYLVGGALGCLALGVAAGATCCPIVKRIWTPAWVLFSGGYVMGMLALFYLLFDLLPLKRMAFPLVVVGMNSIFVYMTGQLARTWLADKVVDIHFGWAISRLLERIAEPIGATKVWGVDSIEAGKILADVFEPLITSVSALAVIWLLCYWLYRQRIFIRI